MLSKRTKLISTFELEKEVTKKQQRTIQTLF